MATPGTEACDAVGGALRPKWREWPSRAIRRVLSERVAFGILPAALFALLPSCRLLPDYGRVGRSRHNPENNRQLGSNAKSAAGRMAKAERKSTRLNASHTRTAY